MQKWIRIGTQNLPLPNSCPAPCGARVVPVAGQGQSGGGRRGQLPAPAQVAAGEGGRKRDCLAPSFWLTLHCPTGPDLWSTNAKRKWLRPLRQQLQRLGSQGWGGREAGPSEAALCDCLSEMPMELVLLPAPSPQPFISSVGNQDSVFVKGHTSKLFLELFTNKDSYNTAESSSGLFLHTFIPSQIYWTLTSF